MRFDFFEEFSQMFGLIPQVKNVMEQLYITYFSSFTPVSDNTKIKPGDFYDQKNKVYYIVKKTNDGIYLIPNSDTIDISKNTVSMFIRDTNVQIFTISNKSLIHELFIIHKNLIAYYVGLFKTNYYDSDTLNYILENKLLPDYEKFIDLSKNLQTKKIEPDISYSLDSENKTIKKRIYDVSENINIEFPTQVQEYKFACDLDNSIKEYKQKVKSIFPKGE